MTIRTLVNAAVVLALAIGFGACGGSNSPSSPDPGNNGTIAATIVIDSTGNVTPRDVTVMAGSRVTFTNNHNTSHQMASDPHPVHTDCPPMNAVGIISNGQTKLTNAFTAARSCGFHDHDDPDNGALRGRITIQ